MAPSKHNPVILEKSCKCLADCRAGEGTNLGSLIGLGVVKEYLFKPFNGLHHHLVFFYVHCLEVVIHFHHSYVAFAYGYLISMQLPYSIIGREFDH